MHVLYFHQHFSTPSGSSGIRSYEMAQALLREGHTVTMVCGSNSQSKTGLTRPFSKGKRRGTVNGIDVIEFELKYDNSMSVFERIKVFLSFAIASVRVALKEPSDVVFATSTPLTAGIPSIIAKWVKRKPFVFEVRDLWPELPRALGMKNPIALGLMSILEWASYRSADRLIGLSPGLVEGMVRSGISAKNIVMVPNGCDFNVFADPAEIWRPVGVGDDKMLAIFSGTHGLANGLDAVLDAAAELKSRKRDDICFVLIGEGREKARLMKRAQDENLSSIVFLDAVPKTKLAGLLAGADIGLQILKDVPAFYYGTSPNKFFDYIAAGLPVLNNYPGWLAEMIVDNDCGFAVPSSNSAAFADALIQASDDRSALKKMGVRAQNLGKRQFSRDKLAKDWLACLVQALALNRNSKQ